MIFTLGVFVVAILAALLAWGRLGDHLKVVGPTKDNYRGLPIFSASGIILIAVEALVVANVYWGFSASIYGSHALAVLCLVAIFGLLGWIDDTKAQSLAGGFEGHIRASLTQRSMTTGLMKLVGGVVVAFFAVWIADISEGLVELTRGAAIVALGANLLNLFDRAPARSSKISLLWFLLLFVPILVWGDIYSMLHLVWAAGVVGASIGLAPSELLERHMQGDTGVNPTGAVLGFCTLLVSGNLVQWGVLVILALLNLLSEKVSFSSVIERNALLSRIDRAGLRPRGIKS